MGDNTAAAYVGYSVRGGWSRKTPCETGQESTGLEDLAQFTSAPSQKEAIPMEITTGMIDDESGHTTGRHVSRHGQGQAYR